MKHWLIALLFLVSINLPAQYLKLSPQAEISVITVGPGPNLYDCFGHSAFRLVDPLQGIDLAYNYGTFNTEEPNFYLRFSMGVAEYYLSAYDFKYFLGSYQQQNRWLVEQVLDLDQEAKQTIFEYLENNRLPENKFYRYDQFYDNCATRLRDVVRDALDGKLKFHEDHLVKGRSIRNLIDENTYNFPWWDFGIDIALGSLIDRDASADDFMFLPDYVQQAYANATIDKGGNSVPAVKETRTLFASDFYEIDKNVFPAWIVVAIISALLIWWTGRDYRRKHRSRWLDFSVMLLTGLTGLLIVVLWFATRHTTAANNFNFLWAFFPNLIVAFFIVKKNPPRWVRSYVRALFIFLILMLGIWIFQVQVFSIAVLPLVIFLAIRYYSLWQLKLIRLS